MTREIIKSFCPLKQSFHLGGFDVNCSGGILEEKFIKNNLVCKGKDGK